MTDLQDKTRPDTPQIRLRVERFDAMTALLGYGNDTKRAQLLGVTSRTMRRVRTGVIGEEFMAKAVAALGQHRTRLAEYNLEPSLDALFEVVEQREPIAA